MATSAQRRGPDPQISSRRAGRLYRLLSTLEKGAKTRSQLIKLGRAGMRTFYRDLTFLEECRIEVRLNAGKYELTTQFNDALGRLPFPTPELTFKDVMELAKGSGGAAGKLKAHLAQLTK